MLHPRPPGRLATRPRGSAWSWRLVVRAIRQLIGNDWLLDARVFRARGVTANMALYTRMFGPLCLTSNPGTQRWHHTSATPCGSDTRNEFGRSSMVRYAIETIGIDEPGACRLRTGRGALRRSLTLLPQRRWHRTGGREYMGVTPRTIQRRLTEREGKTFPPLVNEIRRQLATRYVFESRYS